ncbi:deleted in azoospermia-like isoform X1 [Nerophis lumbriciformis]|uniref:deleted in azoospermia-like isoform X1 n=1 Tax=Nerophis lumbriciformis TaxID=546530 RepID=UPI002AE06B8E|nr:deleted in azoospermia-like isoform X1 [Nerophis lumbriciformis]
MDTPNPKDSHHASPSLQLSNGFMVPEGNVNPNAIFVFFGVGTRATATNLRDLFAPFGQIKEVKIITYRGGFSKGYGFVYFDEDVDIQPIVDQQIVWKGRTLRLGPAIIKQRNCRVRQSHQMSLEPWMNPSQYMYCPCYPLTGASMTPPSPMVNGGGSPYYQPYHYTPYGGFIVPQVPVNNTQNAYCYQSFLPPPLSRPTSDPLPLGPAQTHTQYTQSYWTGDQRVRPVNQNPMDFGVQTMLTAL